MIYANRVAVSEYEGHTVAGHGGNMATHVETLEAEALQLPAAERALLVQALIASLDTEAGVEDAWAEEVERRHAQIESGEVQWVPGPEALAKIRAKHA
jgi:putative addiction module component (TIGR02574 family)